MTTASHDLSLADRVARLEDAEAIRALKHHYARLCDTGLDADAITGLFAPDDDVVWQSNVFGTHAGRDAIHAYFSGIGDQIRWAAHYMVNPTVRVAPDGLTAEGTWLLLELATMPALDGFVGNDAVIMTGFYQDRFRKVDGEWKFTRIQIDFDHVSNLDAGWARQPNRGGAPADVAAGRAV
ncbi:nuclear transport factor 2 family protein [Actinomadura chibensis]|uniref:Nuclear transport factor 2 family protein n=1 Tax=Actinomadura chibensis TaxID=392828 RepID=A0A5D0N6V1_9ACTN|nr:nuclear transport factor 2 family protein [Actinomadura chibensis]TYB40123.1 nuclear transport factor 2 family protein [Actinomadura chibensis]